MEEECQIVSDRFDLLTKQHRKQDMVDMYNEWADTYDKDLDIIGSKHSQYTAIGALEFCPCSVEDALVLDVGCGTGRVAEHLNKRGFKSIDALDASQNLLTKAEEKGIYRKFFCEYFTKEPLDIPENTYDIIVTSGTMISGHLPYDSLYEMIRLVRKGGIICMATRTSSLDADSVCEYKDRLLPLMNELELAGKWKKLKCDKIPDYNRSHDGMIAVYEVQ